MIHAGGQLIIAWTSLLQANNIITQKLLQNTTHDDDELCFASVKFSKFRTFAFEQVNDLISNSDIFWILLRTLNSTRTLCVNLFKTQGRFPGLTVTTLSTTTIAFYKIKVE